MKQLFILLITIFYFAKSNGQDSLELKNRIDSIVEDSNKEFRIEIQKRDRLTLNKMHPQPGESPVEYHGKSYRYKLENQTTPVIICEFYIKASGDTIEVATYYFDKSRPIKIKVIGEEKKKMVEFSMYIFDEKRIATPELYYLARAKELMKEAKRKKWLH
jgi:hypothetical protein